MGSKILENKQVYRKPGDFQKQSKTKQNKRAEWMVMSSVGSKRRGNCRHASRKCGVASIGIQGALGRPLSGTSRDPRSPHVYKTASLLFKVHFSHQT